MNCRRVETYKILPPPNMGKRMVDEVVPYSIVRSINSVVNSAYNIIIAGITMALANVQTMPINIKVKSHEAA